MHAAGPKDHPLSIRLPEADVAIIDRAAGLRGRSRTDFVREAALRAAEEVLMDRTLVRMSPAAFAAFRAAIDAPAAPVPELVDLLRRPAPWEDRPTAERGMALSAPELLTARHEVTRFTCGQLALDPWRRTWRATIS